MKNTQSETFIDPYFGAVRVTVVAGKDLQLAVDAKRKSLKHEAEMIKANRGILHPITKQN